jgi:shikimate dehydrogenase
MCDMASERAVHRAADRRQEMDGQTQLVGVMGWPVAHSLSPVMHNAVLRAVGLNWRYVPLAVHSDDVVAALRGAAALGFRGFNVTVPHKQAVIAQMDVVTPAAEAVGAVNTVTIERDGHEAPRLIGHNTDIMGFLDSLRAGGFDPSPGGRAVVVGAGGAARAVVYGLLRSGLDAVVVLNRTVSRAMALVAELGPTTPEAVHLDGGALSPATLVRETEDARLLVNATTLGMWPETAGSIWPSPAPFPAHLAVYDLVYNPLETRLLRQAREAGALPIDGLGMLARQGALALARWLDTEVDVDAIAAAMRRAAMQALERRRGCAAEGVV